MQLSVAVSLIRSNSLQLKYPAICADLGAGNGTFTNALSTQLHEGSEIIAIDRNPMSLEKIKISSRVKLTTICADFILDDLPLNDLDLLLMANSLHFVQGKNTLIKSLSACMKPQAPFLIVEYDLDKSNPWVPFPLAVSGYRELFAEVGYKTFEIINRTPSRYHRVDIVGMFIAT